MHARQQSEWFEKVCIHMYSSQMRSRPCLADEPGLSDTTSAHIIPPRARLTRLPPTPTLLLLLLLT